MNDLGSKPDRKWWVAHVRTSDYRQLDRRGFLVLYPDVDDYVFLEAKDENKKLLRKQPELGVMFLKNRSQFATVTEAEVARMIKKATPVALKPGSEIVVISGFAESLTGTVLEEIGVEVRVLLRGYRKVYDVLVNRLDLSLST